MGLTKDGVVTVTAMLFSIKAIVSVALGNFCVLFEVYTKLSCRANGVVDRNSKLPFISVTIVTVGLFIAPYRKRLTRSPGAATL